MSRPLTISDLKDPREQIFAAAVFELGGPEHGAEAAIRAGYTTKPAEAQSIANMLLASTRIARAIAGETKARFDVAAAGAFNTILEICQDPRAPASARLAAAQSIIDRSSVGPVVSRSAVLQATVGIEEMLEQLDISNRSGPSSESGLEDRAPLFE